jgi:hypothetical protein
MRRRTRQTRIWNLLPFTKALNGRRAGELGSENLLKDRVRGRVGAGKPGARPLGLKAFFSKSTLSGIDK